jgi:hypothetical protein
MSYHGTHVVVIEIPEGSWVAALPVEASDVAGPDIVGVLITR